MKVKRMVESGIVKRGNGKLNKITVNSHSSGTLVVYDALGAGVQATGTLTSSGACVPANYAVSVFTTTGVFTANETITIGTTVYRMVATPSVAYDVALGADTAAALDNLKLAINGTGTAGTNYGRGTIAHPDVIATTNTDTAQTIRSRQIGNAALTATINAIATTETCANASWADTTLGGGTGSSDPAVTTDAATITIGDVTYTAVLSLGETHGLTSVPYQVLWVTSEAVFLDNLKAAINGSGVIGTDYSTATTEHPQVYATTNTNTAQTVVSKTTGTGGNSIATTETMANYAWGATTLASGTGINGKIMHNTMTISAVATTGERVLDFNSMDGGEEFENGLYIAIGGTSADITVGYD